MRLYATGPASEFNRLACKPASDLFASHKEPFIYVAYHYHGDILQQGTHHRPFSLAACSTEPLVLLSGSASIALGSSHGRSGHSSLPPSNNRSSRRYYLSSHYNFDSFTARFPSTPTSPLGYNIIRKIMGDLIRIGRT